MSTAYGVRDDILNSLIMNIYIATKNNYLVKGGLLVEFQGGIFFK